MGKLINTSHVTDSAGLPFLSRSIDWLQNGRWEDQKEILNSINKNVAENEVWQFNYLNLTNTSGTTWTWTDGSVLFNKEVYKVTNGTATLVGGEFLVWYYITTAQGGEPTLYTDGSWFQTNENVTIGIRKNTEGSYIQAVDLLRYINLEKSVTGDLDYKLVKRGNVYTFTYKSNAVDFFDGRFEFEILKNFNGSLYLNKVEFPCHFTGESLVANNPYDVYLTRLFVDSGTLKVNIQAKTSGSISFVA